MNGYPTDIVAAQLYLAGVQARPDLDPKPAHRGTKRARAIDRPSRTVERGQRAVAGVLHEATSELLHMPGDHRVVIVEQLAPPAIAQGGRSIGRADDVGEHHRRQHTIEIGRPADAGEE